MDCLAAEPHRIYGFLDPGQCLLRCFRDLKRSHPGASHRYIAASIGMKSSASFTLLIRGRIHPSPRVVDALARVFGLGAEERDHLSLLFEMRRMQDPAARGILRRLILQRQGYPADFSTAAEKPPKVPGLDLYPGSGSRS